MVGEVPVVISYEWLESDGGKINNQSSCIALEKVVTEWFVEPFARIDKF